jgi:hypothetical protein
MSYGVNTVDENSTEDFDLGAHLAALEAEDYYVEDMEDE